MAGLAKAISSLVEDPQRAGTMGAAGRERVVLRHAPGSYYERLTQLYERLTSRTKRTILIPAAAPVKTPLRIAFIGGRGVISGYSGVETYYEETGKRLAAMGHEVTVYCRSHFCSPVREHQGMRLVRLPTLRGKHLETGVHTLLSTLHVMFRGCDIVHYQTLGAALFSFLPRLAGKRTVVTVQGLDWRRSKWGGFARAALKLGEWASARLPNATVVVSEALRDHYRERYGIEAAHVPNGTVIRRSRNPLWVCKWGLRPGHYILYLGRFSPEKNCHMLAECYQRIQTDVTLVLAGGGGSSKYENELRRYQSEKIRILDWVSGMDLDELLANAMLFVLPSDVEGLSLALLDAMGAGVCPLASDISENREALGDVGFTFRCGDALDLERMLRLLIHDRRTRHGAGHLGRERVRERYLWTKVAAEIESVYYDVLPQASSARQGTASEAQAGPGIEAA